MWMAYQPFCLACGIGPIGRTGHHVLPWFPPDVKKRSNNVPSSPLCFEWYLLLLALGRLGDGVFVNPVWSSLVVVLVEVDRALTVNLLTAPYHNKKPKKSTANLQDHIYSYPSRQPRTALSPVVFMDSNNVVSEPPWYVNNSYIHTGSSHQHNRFREWQKESEDGISGQIIKFMSGHGSVWSEWYEIDDGILGSYRSCGYCLRYTFPINLPFIEMGKHSRIPPQLTYFTYYANASHNFLDK